MKNTFLGKKGRGLVQRSKKESSFFAKDLSSWTAAGKVWPGLDKSAQVWTGPGQAWSGAGPVDNYQILTCCKILHALVPKPFILKDDD